jgi:hypothetical protein
VEDKLNVVPSFDALLIISKTVIIERQVLYGYYHVAIRLNVVSQNMPLKLIKMSDVIT